MDVGGPQTEVLFRLMQATTLRAKVIAGNVANQNTPGYVRKTVRFEDDLRAALQGGESTRGLAPTVEEDELSPKRADGNNVTLELELNSMRENRIMYETYSTILGAHFEMLRTAIKDGN